MREAMLLAATMAMVGCGESGPLKSRLSAGAEAVVYNDPKVPERNDYTPVDVPKGTGFYGSDHVDVLFETTVEILEDQEDTETDDPERLVRIRMLEGEHKGRSGKIKRWFLRPLPAK